MEFNKKYICLCSHEWEWHTTITGHCAHFEHIKTELTGKNCFCDGFRLDNLKFLENYEQDTL